MIYEIGNYRIKPYPNGLCWEIFEYRELKPKEGEPRMDWVSLGLYPTNFGRALVIVYERILKDGDDVVEGIENAIELANAIEKRLLTAEPKGEE